MRNRNKLFQYVKFNHRGSTILMVIICIAFLGILGSLMLSVSLMNLQMKRVESRSKDNFYYCETALEEIRLGVEELTTEAIKEVYKEEVLKKYIVYAAKDEITRNKEIQRIILNKVCEKLSEKTVITPAEYPNIINTFKKYLSLTKADSLLSIDDNYNISIQSTETGELTASYTFAIKGVRIAFIEYGYETSITSDIRITLPSFTFKEGEDTLTYSMDQPFEKYALVADGEVLSENNIGVNKIIGNTYAGKGITVKDTDPGLTDSHTLIMNGKYISTRGDIKAVDSAVLKIGNTIRPYLWADNLLTHTTPNYILGTSAETTLDINAISLIKDDLAIDGRNSKVNLTGAYVGYTGGFNVASSAMMINGSNSSLNLEGLSSMILAGRAHISVKDSTRENANMPDTVFTIITGESLAFKSNQRAYLVPGDYIRLGDRETGPAAMHNPITEKDLEIGLPVVNVPLLFDPNKKLYYNCYIKAAPNQSVLVSKQTAAGGVDILRYFYLNFKSGILADRYLVDYMTKYPTALQHINNFSIKNVKLPTNLANIVTVGNVMYYNASLEEPLQYVKGLSDDYALEAKAADETRNEEMDQELENAIGDRKFSSFTHTSIYQNTILYDTTDPSNVIDKKIRDLAVIYSNMTHNLSPEEEENEIGEEEEVVAATVRKSGIEQAAIGYSPKSTGFTFYNFLTGNSWGSSDLNAKSIVVINGDAEIKSGSIFNGFFIASGNVTIGDGAIINGMVIAAGNETSPGNITIGNHAEIHGKTIAHGDIILKEGCTIDCTGNTTFDPTLPVDTFLKDLFHNDAKLLWKFFKNPTLNINGTPGSSSGLVDIRNLVSLENWRKNK